MGIRRQIEIQKKAFALILGKVYISYEVALAKLDPERLVNRKVNLVIIFAEKCLKSNQHEK